MVLFRVVVILVLLEINQGLTNDYKIINKYPRSPLLRYYSYSSVMILHFYIPTDTIEAKFEFRAVDEKTSIFTSKCVIRDVSIYLKHGSYPVINPDGIPFPNSFLNITRPKMCEIEIKTDQEPNIINITSPRPGDWFVVAFLPWADPRKDRIEQQGLTSACNPFLFSQLSILQKHNIESVTSNNQISFCLNKPQLLKFFVPENIDRILFEIDLKNCKNCKDIVIYFQPGSIPNQYKYQDKILISSKKGKKQFYFWGEEDNWHYLNISFVNYIKNCLEIDLKMKFLSGLLEENYVFANESRINLFKTSFDKKMSLKNSLLQYSLPYKQYNLMRISGTENFLFEYDFRPNKNGSTPLLLNITNYEMTVLKFTIREIIDIGGTISLGLAIKPDFSNDSPSEKYKIIACIRANSREVPIYQNSCVSNSNTTKAPIVLNSAKKGTLEYVHLPYPDPGQYYLSIRAFYDCVPCNCSESCETLFETCVVNCELNCAENCTFCTESCKDELLMENDCELCNCDSGCWTGNETVKNTSVVFAVTSHPCIAGSCGKKGICNNYMSGGFIFSSCYCKGGYRGWDCSDDTYALSDSEILIAILLLTLSNLLFIPSIYFAYKRGYYTEGITYFCSMFASAFYHACDSKENQYGFCMFPISVLQFCDFYCALLTIWITLVAMSYIPNKFISIAHISGAIILAFSVTLNRHALWVFILPAVLGILLVITNWILQCRKTKQLFPAKKYLKLYMPIGGILVATGLISFAFLETKENYKIVHSLWHVLMAVSLIFLLPNKNIFVPKT